MADDKQLSEVNELQPIEVVNIENEVEAVNDLSEVQGDDVKLDVYQLPAGSALAMEDTYSITSSEESKFIVLVGPSACGKTTLVTSLYQLFQKEPLGGFYFAGSQTLQGFEQRAFFTRTSSKLSNPQTLKTRRGISD